MKKCKGSGFVVFMLVIAVVGIFTLVFSFDSGDTGAVRRLKRDIAAQPEENCFIKLPDYMLVGELSDFLKKHPGFEAIFDTKSGAAVLKRKNCGK